MLICTDLVNTLLLHRRLLHKPEIIELAMESDGQKSQIMLCEYDYTIRRTTGDPGLSEP